MRQRVRFCAAKAERLRIQRREKMFATKNQSRFRLPNSKNRCSKLVADEDTISDPQALMEIWTKHFGDLAKSHVDSCDKLQDLQRQVVNLTDKSLANEECLLDTPFSRWNMQAEEEGSRSGQPSS